MVQACLNEQCGITNTFTNSLLVFLLIPLQVALYKRSILNVISVQLMNAYIKSQLQLIDHFENSYHAVLRGGFICINEIYRDYEFHGWFRSALKKAFP